MMGGDDAAGRLPGEDARELAVVAVQAGHVDERSEIRGVCSGFFREIDVRCGVLRAVFLADEAFAIRSIDSRFPFILRNCDPGCDTE